MDAFIFYQIAIGIKLAMDEIRTVPLIEGEDEDDQSFVDEAAEINLIVKRVTDSEGKDAETVYDRWKSIVSTLQSCMAVVTSTQRTCNQAD